MAEWDPASSWRGANESEVPNPDSEQTDATTMHDDQLHDDQLHDDQIATDEQPDYSGYAFSERDEEQEEASNEPLAQTATKPLPTRFKKRRVVIGCFFLALGLAGVIADLFGGSAGEALAIGGLVASVALLAALVSGSRRSAAPVAN